MIVGAGGEDPLHGGEDRPGDAQERGPAVRVPDVGGRRLDQKRAPVGIDPGVALAALDPLPASAPRAARFGGLDALAVEEPPKGWRAPDPLAVGDYQGIV